MNARWPLIVMSGLLLTVGAGSPVEAAEIKLICAVGIQDVMEQLGPAFERTTGHKLEMSFSSGGTTIKRAQGGEATDVVIAPSEGVANLIKGGKAAPGSATTIARSGISVAVRKGAPKPDISTPEALKRALLAAKTITYLNPADGGASGIHFAKVLERLGIAAEMKSKTVFAPKAGAVGPMIAKGEAELGATQFQLLFSVPGIEIVGSLPGDLQNTTVFTAVIMGSSRDSTTAQALINFLRTPEAAQAIKAKGMEPG